MELYYKKLVACCGFSVALEDIHGILLYNYSTLEFKKPCSGSSGDFV